MTRDMHMYSQQIPELSNVLSKGACKLSRVSYVTQNTVVIQSNCRIPIYVATSQITSIQTSFNFSKTEVEEKKIPT